MPRVEVGWFEIVGPAAGAGSDVGESLGRGVARPEGVGEFLGGGGEVGQAVFGNVVQGLA